MTRLQLGILFSSDQQNQERLLRDLITTQLFRELEATTISDVHQRIVELGTTFSELEMGAPI